MAKTVKNKSLIEIEREPDMVVTEKQISNNVERNLGPGPPFHYDTIQGDINMALQDSIPVLAEAGIIPPIPIEKIKVLATSVFFMMWAWFKFRENIKWEGEHQ